MKAAVAQPCKQGIVHHLSHYVRFLPPNVQIIMFGLVIFFGNACLSQETVWYFGLVQTSDIG
jgi:hypothetical protein